MDIKPWSKVKITEPEAVLFIYLMFREDYGYHIAQEFSKAIENKNWDERRGLSSLKHENKVSRLLFGMARKNLLFELPGPGVGRPKNNSIKADMVNNPRRKYYRVNSSVLALTHSFVLAEEEIKNVRKYMRVHDVDPDDLPKEAYIQYFDPAIIAINREIGCHSEVSITAVSAALQLLELCAPKQSICIEWINGLKKFNYLTILMTARALFKEIIDYLPLSERNAFITLDKRHKASNPEDASIVAAMNDFIDPYPSGPPSISKEFVVDSLRELIKEGFLRVQDGVLEPVFQLKEKNKRDKFAAAIKEFKEDIEIIEHKSDILSFDKIKNKLKQFREEHGEHSDELIASGLSYLETIIKHLDLIIGQVPYFDRGLESMILEQSMLSRDIPDPSYTDFHILESFVRTLSSL